MGYNRICVNTRYRQNEANSTPTNCVVKLPRTYNMKSYTIEWVCIPTTNYVVNSSNNVFDVEEADSDTDTITITPGNYTLAELATELATELNASGSLDATYTVSADTKTAKITISATQNIALDFRTSTNSNSAFEVCGFENALLASAGSHTSSNVCDLNGTKYFVLDVAELGGDLYPTGVGSAGLSCYIIPVDAPAFSIQTDRNDRERCYDEHVNKSINRLDITLRDEKNEIVELNGASISFSMLVRE